MDVYGLGAAALVVTIFWFVRKIPWYLALSVAVAVACAAATFRLAASGGAWAEWAVLVAGQLAGIFGLLIVRVMLVRSVSLRLLRSIKTGQPETIVEDIGRRLDDMRAFRLVGAAPGGRFALTPFGWLVGSAVAVLYAVLRVGR